MRRAEVVVKRARALVGTRFRAQGRGAGEGLDCVGLVAAALGYADVRRDYALRGGAVAVLEGELAAAGLVPGGEALAGDVLVLRAGPGQLHLGIWTGDGLVHADAGLRRVVERPGAVPWPVVGVWREAESEGRALHRGPSTTACACGAVHSERRRKRRRRGGGPPPRPGED